ncbi:MAG: class I SAM-dependent methyltransferase [Helicobacteraceae bacterium]|jgi:SAM-dependent methyltransferase|nr:class I SAM-dependent methyltransferase [Helicobacteraceae bacterium]
MNKLLKWAKERANGNDAETREIVRLAKKHGGLNARILDVDCGYGRNLTALKNAGFTQIAGVDANPHSIETLKEKGFEVFLPQNLGEASEYDLLIASHIIEHFAPNDLLGFLDFYLDRLKASGHIIIAAPLANPLFYNDFDHVKPYGVTSVLQVFANENNQVAIRAKNALALADKVYLRRMPFLRFGAKAQCAIPLNICERILRDLSYLLFIASGNKFGAANSWCAIFKKL